MLEVFFDKLKTRLLQRLRVLRSKKIRLDAVRILRLGVGALCGTLVDASNRKPDRKHPSVQWMRRTQAQSGALFPGATRKRSVLI